MLRLSISHYKVRVHMYVYSLMLIRHRYVITRKEDLLRTLITNVNMTIYKTYISTAHIMYM
jgi:hypothetical protein